jgi:LuxR family transcriptional regulator, maltose regulon positive regulatory protein
LQSIDIDLAAGTQKLLNGMNPPSSPAIIRSLVAEILSATSPFVLVLDDYHVIDNPEIHDAMAELLLQVPPAMRVVLVSRTDPPLPLARLRSRQDLFDLGQEDLRITDDEAVELMRQSDRLEVTPSEAITLNERAEGWVAGLQLVGHVLRGQSPERIRRFATEFTGSVRSIETYLWEEVIGRQREAVRTILLRTSILDRFSASLCQAVTGNSESGAITRQLEQDHLDGRDGPPRDGQTTTKGVEVWISWLAGGEPEVQAAVIERLHALFPKGHLRARTVRGTVAPQPAVVRSPSARRPSPEDRNAAS